MIKNLKFAIFSVLLISCTDPNNEITESEVGDINNPELIDIKFDVKLSVDKMSGNIYDQFIFKLKDGDKTINGEGFYVMADLSDKLDSIVFKVDNQDAVGKILKQDSHSGTLRTEWGHYFFTPGTYKTRLLGYKNNKIIYKDSVTVNIENSKDFLNSNWNEVPNPAPHPNAFSNIDSPNYFTVNSWLENNVPSTALHNRWNVENQFDLKHINKNKDILFNYINKLYSLPQYSYESDDNMEEIYNQNFTKSLDNSQPLYIWKTNSSNIVLLKYNDNYNDNYMIYAEPKK